MASRNRFKDLTRRILAARRTTPTSRSEIRDLRWAQPLLLATASGILLALSFPGWNADAIAWCATHFDAAPPIVNLFDPDVTTRGAFLQRLRARGWAGRMVWVPISAISFAVVAARTAQAVLRGRMPARLAAWSVLKPRRYDGQVAAKVLASCR